MSTLQIKNLPEELHAALGARAQAQGMTMSEYVTRLLRRDLSRPTMADWTAQVASGHGRTRAIDVVAAVDEARLELGGDEPRGDAPR